jgi:competence protein ComEC
VGEIAAAKQIGAAESGGANSGTSRNPAFAWLDRIAALPPLYGVTAAVLIGDGAGNLGLAIPFWICVALAFGAASLMTARRAPAGLIVAYAAIAGAATIPIARLLNPASGPLSLDRFADGSSVTIVGRIAQAPEREPGGRTYLFVKVARAGLNPNLLAPCQGLIRVTALGGADRFRMGQTIEATGGIRFPRNEGNPGQFDYRDWLLRQGLAATMFVRPDKSSKLSPIRIMAYRPVFLGREIEHARRRIGALIDANLRYPADVEMRALIIGDRGGIDPALRRRFAFTGMAHLLVISGLHMGIVAGAVFILMRLIMSFFPSLMAYGYANKAAAIAGAIAVCGYAAIAGHHVSTMRAVVMVVAYALTIALDRPREVMASLALAALAICLALPGSTADIGFQLSFVAVAAIVLGMRRFAAWWRMRFAAAESSVRLNAAESVAGYFAVSFWALLGTAPLTAYYFNQLSLVGVIANAVVVPIMGFGAVMTGLAAALLLSINAGAAGLAIRLAGRLAGWGTALAGWFYGWPLGWSRIFTPTAAEIAIAYALLALWLTAPRANAALQIPAEGDPTVRKSETNLIWRRRAFALILIALASDAGWWTWRRCFNDALRITFLSVGEGDAAVIRFPGVRVMLIDGGGGYRDAFDPGERIVAPYLWAQKIMRVDYVALSHPDHDHFGGLIFIAENFHPREFWTSGVGSDDSSYGRLLAAMRAAGARELACGSDAPARTIGGAAVRCLWPAPGVVERKDNNSSMAVRISYDGSSVLFTGDLEAKGERELIASGAHLRADVLKVPHHGSATSSSPELIAAVRPRLAIVSDGYLNRFGFPAPAVIARYRAAPAIVLRTDRDGAVRVVIGASGIAVNSWLGGRARLVVDDPARPVEK